jgi:hypothetical protein
LTTLENHEVNPEHSREKMTYGKDAIEWRRARVLELDCQGYTHREIVAKLQKQKELLAMTWPILESRLRITSSITFMRWYQKSIRNA